ncbi:MAG: DSD1 family PLP-dependent enzyme [Spirochaetaceae bacterium]|nr:DSD1 family PLP-dependent enzyme [Spirochaetaceae bacterium]
MSYLPARVGDAVADVETPALLLDLDAAETNIARLQEVTAGTRARPRPHAKSHKCPNLARLQVAHGAVGVCCQKVSEAVAMVDGGIGDVLVSNQVVDAAKIRRLAALARRARIGVCVDQADNVADLSAAAAAAGSELAVLVEIEVGMRRCGVPPGAPAVALARQVADAPHLRFAGLQAYHGSSQHLATPEERRAASLQVAGVVRDCVAALAAAGLPCATVSGSGSGTCRYDAESGVFTEIQAGSYVVMDVGYGDCGVGFEHSLFLLAQVMSAPRSGVVVVDAGLKAFTAESGLPRVAAVPGHDWQAAVVGGASDEHATLDVSGVARPPRIGDKVRMIPPHCDPTVNLHDWLVCIRGERVVDLWPVSARGPGF